MNPDPNETETTDDTAKSADGSETPTEALPTGE
jgi:hypothetical protein